MKTTIATIIIATMSAFTVAANVSTGLLDRIALVESGRDDAAVNLTSGATGRYQITAPYLSDANRFLGTSYSLEEMHEPDKAERVVRAYLAHYGSAWERRTGLAATPVILARIHNGGPNGPDKDYTESYGDAFIDLTEDGE